MLEVADFKGNLFSQLLCKKLVDIFKNILERS